MPKLQSRIAPTSHPGGYVMATDHGTHPPELYAQVAAMQIAPINPDMTGARRRAAQALQDKIAEALEGHHQAILDKETAALASDTDHHLKAPDPSAHVDDAVASIYEAAKGSEWEGQFQHADEPAWLAAHLQDVAEMGADAEPLSPEQELELKNFQRHSLIKQLVGTHMATHQHVERATHADKLKGAQ